jgi:DNA polymerase-3 subunit gamma/tau
MPRTFPHPKMLRAAWLNFPRTTAGARANCTVRATAAMAMAATVNYQGKRHGQRNRCHSRGRSRKWLDSHAARRPGNPDPQAMPVGRVETKVGRGAEAESSVNSISDIVNLASEKRDAKIKALVRTFVRPVRVEPGRLDVNLTDGAPPTLLNELAVKLKDWTGIHWIVSLSREAWVSRPWSRRKPAPGNSRSATRARIRMSPRSSRSSPAPRSSTCASERRSRGREVQAPAAAESEEGDILPGDDLEF